MFKLRKINNLKQQQSMITLNKFFVFILLSISLVSCQDMMVVQVEGEGPVVMNEFEIDNFNQLSLHSGWKVLLIPSDENKLVLEANENLVELLEIEQKGNRLKIDSEKLIKKADSKLIQLYYNQELTEIKTSSGVYLIAEDIKHSGNLNLVSTSGSKLELSFEGEKLAAETTSGASIHLTGSAAYLVVKSTSGSGFEAETFLAKKAKAKANSGANINLNVEEELEAKATSGAIIKHNSGIKNVSKDTNSGGTIKAYSN